MRMTTVSSGRTTTQALTSEDPSAARATVGPPKGISRPSARPVPTAAVPMAKVRRRWGGGVGGGVAGILRDRPKQRRIRLDIHVESFAIDDEVHRRSP